MNKISFTELAILKQVLKNILRQSSEMIFCQTQSKLKQTNLVLDFLG